MSCGDFHSEEYWHGGVCRYCGELMEDLEDNMAKRGTRVTFHGAFKSKAAAKRKENRTRRSYIKPVKIKGHRRYLVLTRRKGR